MSFVIYTFIIGLAIFATEDFWSRPIRSSFLIAAAILLSVLGSRLETCI